MGLTKSQIKWLSTLSSIVMAINVYIAAEAVELAIPKWVIVLLGAISVAAVHIRDALRAEPNGNGEVKPVE